MVMSQNEYDQYEPKMVMSSIINYLNFRIGEVSYQT